ncbi:Predicted tRNA-splicing endonuclease subunit [Ceraceosorus bombacis]|uniref:Predicted tRNA-splicing endonuclease subunit n=1 Tax=Ceraceosorus bombacis TaxID=401625 RepID=A0A0N7LAT1_9BASI|nr:Predicted tRNA-splicing endonuclease subunit [Ceraceosorus bombacis]
MSSSGHPISPSRSSPAPCSARAESATGSVSLAQHASSSAVPLPFRGASRASSQSVTAAQAQAQAEEQEEEEEEDESLDYSALAELARKAIREEEQLFPSSLNTPHASPSPMAPTGSEDAPMQQEREQEQDSASAFIPKRGEKDFEPTGFGGQRRALERSRNNMLLAISGKRRIGSKALSIGTWEPTLNRCVMQVVRGVLFTSMGITRRVGVLTNGQDQDLCEARMAEMCSSLDASDRGQTFAREAPKLAGVTKEGVFYPRLRARYELLPEEAIYLVERGALECRVKVKHHAATFQEAALPAAEQQNFVPMSVQQAFATMMPGAGGRDRYQVYAYLKRLGYHVQRADISDALRSQALSARSVQASSSDSPLAARSSPSTSSDPHAIPLVSLLDIALYPLRRGLQLMEDGTSIVYSAIAGMCGAVWQRLGWSASARETASLMRGTGLLGIGGRVWRSFDDVFAALRIVPSGPDRLLPCRRKSVTCALHDPDRPSSRDTLEDAVGETMMPIVYYAWRPATQFKRSDPPLPEYRISIVNARATGVPSVWDFDETFSSFTSNKAAPGKGAGSASVVGTAPVEDEREVTRAQREKKRNDESYGKGMVKRLQREKKEAERTSLSNSRFLEQESSKDERERRLLAQFCSALRSIVDLWSHAPPGCSRAPLPANKQHKRDTNLATRPPNPFPPLKSGRRNFILAVCDHGTTQMFRFGESDFAAWKLAGRGGAGRG